MNYNSLCVCSLLDEARRKRESACYSHCDACSLQKFSNYKSVYMFHAFQPSVSYHSLLIVRFLLFTYHDTIPFLV